MTFAPPSSLDAIVAKLAAGAAEHDLRAEFPIAAIAQLHAVGIIGMVVPRDLGGPGVELPAALSVIQSVARAEPAVALVITMTWLALRDLDGNTNWPDHLRRRIADDVLRSGALINALRVEPDLGTPARGGLPATIARRDGDQWRISGRKIFSTGSTALTWMLVWGRTDEPDPRVGYFLVHGSSAGIAVEPTWDHLGMRASISHDVIFTDVPTPLDHAIDLRASAQIPVLSPDITVWANTLVAAIYDAVAQAARLWFIDWANNRVPGNLGAPLSSLYRYQETLGSVDGLLLSNRVLLESAAAGRLGSSELALLKFLVTENAISAVDRIVALAGNPGLSRTNALERHHRDVLCGRIHTPQADVALGGAGRASFASAQA